MKAILVIGMILLLAVVVYSGGVGIKDGALNIEPHNTVDKISQTYDYVANEISIAFQAALKDYSKPPPNFELQVTEVRYLNECIEKVIDKKEPCLLVNLEIRNNHSERIDFEMLGKTIVTKDGKQLERYGGLYNTKTLSGTCDTDSYYKLFPGARQVTGMCFPLVSKSDNPKLYIKMSANGKRTEHSFDLTPLVP